MAAQGVAASDAPGARRQGASPPALLIENLSKTFGGQRALVGASLRVEPGEVHGLLGQNGSGKSTLIKILAGFHEPDPGSSLAVHGEPVALPLPPGKFRELGISFVHQHLGLIPALTVVENLLIGRLAASERWGLSWRRERERAAALFARFGLTIDPAADVARLAPVERALLAIVRAVDELEWRGSGGRGLLVLDEPTPFLPRGDVNRLFDVIRRIVGEGSSVIFVSHDVDEVMEITDRATVLRDGRVAGTLATRSSSKDDFVEMIVGRRLVAGVFASSPAATQARSVGVRGLSGEVIRDLSFELAAGEVLGLTGLVGSGYDEVPYLLFGARPAVSGELTLAGKSVRVQEMTPGEAIAQGLALIPADRPNAGAIGVLPVSDNVTMPLLGRAFNALMLDRGGMVRRAVDIAQAFTVQPRDPRLPLSALSGGNQQKVLLGKWLQLEPRLVLLDEPTQGVDVGARQNVFQHIARAAAGGACVICASSDYEQLEAICSRVLVMAQGRVTAELVRPHITKQAIAEHCYAGSPRGGVHDGDGASPAC